jgi:branched-chain amino acid transport system ATP-binding protein
VSDAILQLNNIEAAYGPVVAIRGVSLELPRGKIVALLGANGAGKTTVLKAISGIVEPTRGSIIFDGSQIQCRKPSEIVRQGLCHVPEGREMFPLLTVRENLLMGAFTRRDDIAPDLERIYGYFPVLQERAGQQAGSLSGGQQQMLAIGRALMGSPQLLLLDEPSLGLSPKLTQDIFAIVARINREQGVSVLLVEQNAAVALACADHGYVMELGRIVMHDSAARLLEKEDIKEFYLGQQELGVRGEQRWKRKKSWR